MSEFSRFMKENKKKRENTTYAATSSLCDEQGNPLKWVIKPLTTKEIDSIRDDCTVDIPVKGKPGMYKPTLNTSKYIAKLICQSVVEPNLFDKELQDSYNAMTPEELIKEMIDSPGEYSDFSIFIQEFNNFTTMDEKVEEAKN